MSACHHHVSSWASANASFELNMPTIDCKGKSFAREKILEGKKVGEKEMSKTGEGGHCPPKGSIRYSTWVLYYM